MNWKLFISLILFGVFAHPSMASTSYSLSFQGNNQFVETNFNTSITSLELWIKASNISPNQVICGQQNSDEAKSGNWKLTWDANKSGHLHYQLTKSPKSGQVYTIVSEQKLDAHQWYHISITADGTEIKLLINGHVDNTISSSLIPGGGGNTAPFSLGGCQFNSGSACFQGELDEVRIWAYTRSAEEIMQQMKKSLSKNEYGLLAYFPFNSPSTTKISDCSENSYQAQFSNRNAQHYKNDYLVDLNITNSPIDLQLKRAEKNKVEVQWSSDVKSQGSIFTIQRKNPDGDYETIAIINSNSSATNTFFYLDKSSSAGSYIYRIRQLNPDGKIIESHEQIINQVPLNVAIYPNTEQHSIYVNIDQINPPFFIGLHDLHGNTIFENTYTQAGFILLDLKRVPKGTYRLEVRSGTQKSCTKLILDQAIEIASF
jgi:hypothetical protein